MRRESGEMFLSFHIDHIACILFDFWHESGDNFVSSSDSLLFLPSGKARAALAERCQKSERSGLGNAEWQRDARPRG
jgi:hypothetical protein